MTEYHKINAPFMRDQKTGALLYGQWCLEELNYLQHNDWEWTEKVDGTNIRIEVHRHDDFLTFLYKGKTDRANTPKALVEALRSLFGGDESNHGSIPGASVHPALEVRNDSADALGRIMVERDITDLVIYGEGYGPKINGGGKYGTEPRFVAFDVRVGSFWLNRESVDDLCSNIGLDTVPVIGYGSLHDAIDVVQQGLQSRWGDFEAEGIIAVPKVPLFDRAGRRIITKIKGVDFK
jgi:hypothetical protein